MAEPHPASPDAARTALHQIIAQMSDAEVMALWRLICSWVVARPQHDPDRSDTQFPAHGDTA